MIRVVTWAMMSLALVGGVYVGTMGNMTAKAAAEYTLVGLTVLSLALTARHYWGKKARQSNSSTSPPTYASMQVLRADLFVGFGVFGVAVGFVQLLRALNRS